MAWPVTVIDGLLYVKSVQIEVCGDVLACRSLKLVKSSFHRSHTRVSIRFEPADYDQ